MNSVLKSTLALGLLSVLVACGNKSSDDVQKQVDNNLNSKGNLAIQNATYMNDCSTSDYGIGDLKFPGAQTAYELSDLNFVKRQIYYTDDCHTTAITVQEKGKLNVVARSGSLPGALEEDFNFEHTTVTLSNDKIVAAFNAIKACGAGDWAVNVEKDVSAQASQVLCPGKAAPRTAPEVVLVENNQMFMGANTNQEAAQGRPQALNRNLVFKKH